jgi:4-amino-4-deoxy-L-arabinose transferase-like glycosyltransferase
MSSGTDKPSARPLLLLVLLSLALLLSGNWILPLMDRDEPRFAEASREMLQRGDAVIPWFNGGYRFDKPPLIYWCQMAAYRCLGENPFAARLPSALFATATAVVLWFWGRGLGNSVAGLYAGLMLITCLQCLIHGRLAVADMPMVFFVTLAIWSGWEMTRPRATGRAGWWGLFNLALGLGFLAKGPVAWLPLVGVVLARWQRPSEFRLPWLMTLLGFLMSLVLVGCWGVPALLRTHGEFLKVGIGQHVIFRSFGIMEGHGGPGWIGFVATLPLYFLTFFFSFFPWSFSMRASLRAWWPTRGADLFGWYLLLQAAVVFLVFTLVRTKLPHYTLPAFPILSLWFALRVVDRPDHFQWIRSRVTGMCVALALVTLVLFRVAQPYFVAANLWHQSRSQCSPGTEVASVDFDEPSLVWEFRREVTNHLQQISLEEGREFLGKPGPRILIVPTRLLSGEAGFAVTNGLMFRATGIDTARFRRIDLTALVKPAP